MSYKIGITGGIATGKTLVGNTLEEIKVPVISADEIVHELLEEKFYQNRIKEIFGEEVFDNGILNRKKLAKIIFSNREDREKLNALLHPPVLQEIKRRLELIDFYDIVAVEIPLLFEVGVEDWFDEVWVVYAPLEMQIERIVSRDKVTEEEALLRIKSQMPMEEKIKKADFIIYNVGDVESTKDQVMNRISYLRRMIYNKRLE
ncbi:MAG TPA: dephospho-CoA kinase [Dictyoglomaceae bacterium]|nr:dephospho-CoA kinase [Dictyoglomaceae bacterium]HPU43068.1 dephospho-CoA kinase [Dictyoglomaceae bacterium]